MKSLRLAVLSVAAALAFAAVGCDSFERTAFQTLSASKAVIDAAQSDYEPAPVGTGKLPHSKCVYDIINDAKAAQTAGVDALQTYDVAVNAKQDTTAFAASVTADLAAIALDVPRIKALYAAPCS
jgi:hypothetical protein